MKIVIDTNVIASAIFFGGKPRQLIELLVGKELNAYVTPDIMRQQNIYKINIQRKKY